MRTWFRWDRRDTSIRNLLLLFMAGVMLCVAALGIAVDAVFVPRIRSLRVDTELLLAQMQGFSNHAAMLDTAVAVARREMVAGDTAAARKTVARAEGTTPTSLTAAARHAMVDAPVQMRSALAAAIDGESQIADMLSVTKALLELGRAPRAARALQRADSAVAELGTTLAAAQRAGLRDVARRSMEFETLAGNASRTLLWLVVLSILGVGLMASVVHRRLYVPLRRLDAGLRLVSAGSLDTRVHTSHKDEMGALSDIFNRMVAELQMREREQEAERHEMTRRILEATLDAVITIAPDGRITHWNPGAEATFGWSADDVLGKRLGDVIFPPDERVRHEERLRRIRSGLPEEITRRRIQLTATHRDGHTFQAEESVVPILEGGVVVAVAGFLRDLTETLELQEQIRRSQRLEAVGHLAGGIAHDFNNLLAVILGQTQLVLEQTNGAAAAKELREVERAANRAAELTSQLLAFARRQIVAPKVVDVNSFVTTTVGTLEPVIDPSVRIVRRLDADAGHVSVDPDHLSQVLFNLIMNARDALGPAGGQVEISTDVAHVTDGDSSLQVPVGEYVRIAVLDDGPGIPEEARGRIFEPFFSTKRQGTGLGLSTCHGIVRQAGGAMTAQNVEGHGAEFAVYLPRVASDDTPPAAAR